MKASADETVSVNGDDPPNFFPHQQQSPFLRSSLPRIPPKSSPASFMASKLGPCLPLLPLLLSSLILCLASASASTSNSPQRRLLDTNPPPSSPKNIQTFFPSLPSPAFQNIPLPPPVAPPSLPPAPPPPVLKTSSGNVKRAVAITAASSFGLCGLLFVTFLFLSVRQRKVEAGDGGNSTLNERLQSKPKLQPARSLIVDENGLDAIYWREFNQKRCQYCHHVLDPSGLIEEKEGGVVDHSPPRNDRKIQEKPLLPAGSIRSSSQSFASEQSSASPFSAAAAPMRRSSKHVAASEHQSLPPPPGRLTSSSSPPHPPLPPSHSPPQASNSAPPAPPPPPPPPPPAMNSSAAPRPPPLPPVRKSNAVAPQGTKSNTSAPQSAPPPPPPPGGSRPSSRPPPVPGQSSAAIGAGGGPKKLKPLHWDKMNPINPQHSMVWDKITDGSFKFDEDIMEALFGTMATNKKSSTAARDRGKGAASSTDGGPVTPTQISLLDSRKSQNIAIVLRSLALSRQDILDALVEGRGLPADVLERLTKIAPTKDEEALIRDYTGNPAKLADAESFLFHILRAVSSPFLRLEAMLFRSNYEHEVAHLKQSLQTLELASKELKSRGLFLKLLEAVLKAGNLMNAGTARGNAQAFNLSALCKLSDVKSSDGSTTLLHFVVEEVIRSEGKRLVVNRNHSLRQSGISGPTLDRTTSRAAREEREKEYIKLGLPIVGGISDEFANAKKAAGIDYDVLAGTCASLAARLAEIKRFVDTCGGDGFVIEMRAFMGGAEEELKAVRGEQARVLELVKSTTEYYQPGASKDKGSHPLQLFVIVRDFLNMVDKACVDIARNLQRRRPADAGSASKPGSKAVSAAADQGSDSGRKPMARFPYLPPNFMSENSKSDSSSDDDDDGRS
ncbi:hypothetical protein GW17_00004462 [Ensete ventricosum]|nr:hypothetical protein GW17_00004462 [Ensete ventricosum]